MQLGSVTITILSSHCSPGTRQAWLKKMGLCVRGKNTRGRRCEQQVVCQAKLAILHATGSHYLIDQSTCMSQ